MQDGSNNGDGQGAGEGGGGAQFSLGNYQRAAAPMEPVPGLRDERNPYFPIQKDEGRHMTYMEMVENRKEVEEVIFFTSLFK